jgi:hypothetical protein
MLKPLTQSRVPDSENINVTYKTTRNIYKYDSRNLIISYSIAVFATLIALVLGFYSFHDNGVAHSTVFSAVLATTRNSELDVLSKGHSLGALPLDKRVAGIRLRFGELNRGTEKIGDEDEEGVRHIGFGLENDVLRLRRGGKYI